MKVGRINMDFLAVLLFGFIAAFCAAGAVQILSDVPSAFKTKEYGIGILAIFFGGLCTCFMIICFIIAIMIGTGNVNTEDNTLSDFTRITEKLEKNPFDKDAIHEAVVYNGKVEVENQLDLHDAGSEYEGYLNEPLIDIEQYQVQYIKENLSDENIKNIFTDCSHN